MVANTVDGGTPASVDRCYILSGYWLVTRDPYDGFLEHPYSNWEIYYPISSKQQRSFHCSKKYQVTSSLYSDSNGLKFVFTENL